MDMMALEWARKMKNDGVEVFLVDPGVMATDFGGVSSDAKRQRGVQGPRRVQNSFSLLSRENTTEKACRYSRKKE